VRLNFQVEATAEGSRARAGRFRTLHNEVLTPIFMPVGTHAAVRHQMPEDLEELKAGILLANTYHLMLRPGPEVFERLGGLHGFANWPRSFLTDSGGFQIFSLRLAREMTEEGAVFRSYLDGSQHLLSPEKSIAVQRALGSDIMMVLDECVPSTCDHATAKRAMELTHRWAKRSLVARGDSLQSMFGIVQGACFTDLRQESARVLTQLPFDGFAIGGLAVGESRELREEFTGVVTEMLPAHLPRYLMGVGTPIDLLEAVHRGVDMFDCILPTLFGEQGVVFTSRGRLRIGRGRYKFAEEALDPDCPCPACTRHSKAYLHHLIKAEEPLGKRYCGLHNLHFYFRLMKEIREAITTGRFAEYYARKREELVVTDDGRPPPPPRPGKIRELGAFEIADERDAYARIRHKESGETMHPAMPPQDEAKFLYVEQSGLVDLVRQEGEPLVLWDLGMGASHNAMAAILALEELPQEEIRRGVRIVSFENDLDALRLTLQRPDVFPHIRHAAPSALLRDGRWTSSKAAVSWELLEGDLKELIQEAPAPDLIFFDLYSSKTNSDLWTESLFKKLLACCRRPCELFTYTVATSARLQLLLAGWYVAKGQATGPKMETTLAQTPGNPRTRNLLDRTWLERFERSHARTPLSDEEQERVRQHPQFRTIMGA
jgi:queuine tRNA-ribosyltransferase